MDDIKKFLQGRFEKQIRAKIDVDPKDGIFSDYPENIHPELRAVLEKGGIHRLFSHQREAFESISQNNHTLMVSQTASGKTLSFFLPMLNEYINAESPFSVLLMYPTKALSRDQESTFGPLMNVVKKDNKLGTFDGDTPREEREKIQQSSDFIITNPDMLHSGILPNHNRRWKGYLSRLRYVVIDEVHSYSGAFGSHVSNVFRRLQRVCAIHGANPIFICSSATVGNPKEHVEALFHQEFNVIDKDGSPRPKREIYCINPPLVKSHGFAQYRKGPASVSIPLLREAVKQKKRTICFCRSRQEVERLYRSVTDGNPELAKFIKPYRGGLLPNERRKLERDLSSGKLIAIISTNALELGIDIGDLELCIISGHPGTIASFWQQAGRVGRKGNNSLVVYVAKENPIDQYLVHHPDFLTGAPIEEAWLNADNPYILLQHLPCAAHEHPLRVEEPLFVKNIYSEALEVLKANNTVKPYRENFRYALQDYPARGVNLRGMTDYNIEIYCGTEVIGELDPIGARGTLYKDAIYQHLGKRYMSMDLDLEKKLCRVEPVDVDYFTDAVWEGRVVMTDGLEKKNLHDSPLEFGFINVNKQPKLYKKIRERSYENIGYGPITLDPFEYDTTGFSLFLPKDWSLKIEKIDKRYSNAALYGLRYLLRHTAPTLCMASINNIGTDVSLVEVEEGEWKSALFLYDALEGGVGYAEKIFEKIETALDLCRTIIKECDCDAGCPSCIPPLPPGVDNEALEQLFIESDASTKCTDSLLTYLLDGELVIPEITMNEVAIEAVVEAPEKDEEHERMVLKLNRAADILQKKRERLH